MAPPDPTRDDIERALGAEERLRVAVGDEITDTIVAVLAARLGTRGDTGPRRRLATVLFMDVVGSTDLLRDRDPEETMEIMDAALRRLAGPVEAHGGRVTRFMGDGYLAVFGLPTSRENDPEMAVRAALAVQAEAAAMEPDLAEEHGVDSFAVRIGINTGLVVSGGTTEAQDTIMGAEVNLAARLEAAAPPGGILISHGTLQHVRDVCAVEEFGHIEAKGFTEPVAAHLVRGMLAEHRSGARPIVEGITTPMIGRKTELAMLHAALAAATGDGALREITVSGQPGLGKSRLLREFEDTLPGSILQARARVGPEDRDVPYGLVRDLLTRCFDLRIGDGIDEVHRKLTEGLGPDAPPEAAALLGRLAGFESGGDGDPQRMRDRALAHLATYLRSDSGTVLVVEDLQWADDASVRAVEQLAELLADSPTVLISVARPEFWSDESDADRDRIDLEPLSDDSAGALVDAILSGVDGEVTAVRRLLLERAEGNPHFLEELVRMLVDDGVLVRSGPGWRVEAEGIKDLRVPPTLSGIVQARLDTLSRDESALLQRAAVVGRVFWEDAVTGLAGAESGDLLDRLEAREMIVTRDGGSFPDTREYAFRHPILREVAYERVLLDDRRMLHGLAADWLLDRVGEDGGEVSGIIANHLEKAGRGAEALAFLTRAAEVARLGYAVGAAADFYDRALALVPEDDLERRYDLLFGRQAVSGFQGDRERQGEVIDELEKVADALGDPARQARTAVQRTWNRYYLSDFPGTQEAASRAIEFADRAGDPELESRAHTALAWAHIAADDFDSALQEANRSVSAALQSGVGHTEAAAFNTLGLVGLTKGDPAAGVTALERALEISRREGDVDAEATYINNMSVALMVLGDFQRARRSFEESFELVEAAGDLSTTASTLTNLAWAATSLGDHAAACDFARRALAMKRRQGHREAEAEVLLWLGHALAGLDRFDEALEAYRSSLTIRKDLGQVALAHGVRAGIARALLRRGDIGSALATVEPIISHLDADGSLDGTWEPIRIHLTCAEVLQAAGDDRFDRVLDRAARALDQRVGRIEGPEGRQVMLSIPWHHRVTELRANASS